MPTLGPVYLDQYGTINLFYKVINPSNLYEAPIRRCPLMPYPQTTDQFSYSSWHLLGEDYFNHSPELEYVESGVKANNYCLYFDGKYTYAKNTFVKPTNPSNSSIYSFSSEPYTISMYLSCENHSDRATIFYAGNIDYASATGNTQLFIENNNLFFSVYDKNNEIWYTRCWDASPISSSSPLESPLTHIAIVKERSKFPQLYIDGELQEPVEPDLQRANFVIYNGTPNDSTEFKLFNMLSVCKSVVLGAIPIYIEEYKQYVMTALFQGWLKDVCVRNKAYYTANFTPPISGPNDDEIHQDKIVQFFASLNKSRTESVKDADLQYPVFATTTTNTTSTNGKYSIYIPSHMQVGLAMYDASIQWSGVKRQNDGFTIECTAKADIVYNYSNRTTTNNQSHRYLLSYEVCDYTSANALTFCIRRYHSSKLPTATYGYDAGILFQIGNAFGEITLADPSYLCTANHHYTLSYDAYTRYMYCYVDEHFVGKKSVSPGTDFYGFNQILCIGFSAKEEYSSFGGYISEVKIYSDISKYNTVTDLISACSKYESWMLLYHGVGTSGKDKIMAIELYPEKSSTVTTNVLKSFDTHNLLKMQVATTKNINAIYWAPLVSYHSLKKNVWHPFYSQLKVIHPNGNRCMVMSSRNQKDSPNIYLKNDYINIESQQQWCTVTRQGDFVYVYHTDYDDGANKGTSEDWSCYSTTKKFGTYSFNVAKDTMIVCDHTDGFNLQGSWTIDFFSYYTGSAISTDFDTPIVDLFGSIGISTRGIYYYAEDDYYNVRKLSFRNVALNTGTWYHTAASHYTSGSTHYFRAYVDGVGSSSIGMDESVVSSYFYKRNNDIIIGRKRTNCYIDSFRIRLVKSTATTFTVPTEVSTTELKEKTNYAYLNFNDLKG